MIKKFFHLLRWYRQNSARYVSEIGASIFHGRRSRETKEIPYVVYMTGMPRTGSSLMKNYLGDHPGLRVMPFEKKGFFSCWQESLNGGDVLIDKATHYIKYLPRIDAVCGGHVKYCCIVRDPRDQLLSLMESGRHPELTRTKRFWKEWVRQYSGFMDFAEKREKGRCFLIRYEDLVSCPVSVKRAFLRWLGLKDVNESRITSSYRIAHENDIQDPKVGQRSDIVPDPVGRYKQNGEKRKEEVIMAYSGYRDAKELMMRFGYGDEGAGGVHLPEYCFSPGDPL